MKLIYITDLHGSQEKYNASLELAKSLKVKTIINGGDMLPSRVNLFKQGDFIRDFLDEYFAELNRAKIYHMSYLGNDDLSIFDPLFEEICDKYEYIVPIAQKRFEINNFEFIGMNYVVDYPFTLKDRCRMDTDDYTFQEQYGKAVLSTPNGWNTVEDWYSYARSLPTIEYELNNNLIRPKNMSKAVYVIHMPPSGIQLDVCRHGPRVGSKALYEFLEREQPLLSLHGHIHECPDVTSVWKNLIGNTICIQPGQSDKRKKTLVYVLIDLKKKSYERIVETIF